MERTNNYQLQAQQAKRYFLRYDQQQLTDKLKLHADKEYLYTTMLCKPYRIHRATGDIQRRDGDHWADANTHAEVMTLLDLVCDSRPDRCLSCKWQNMQSFGLMFHQNLLEDQRDPFAEAVQADMNGFRHACLALSGEPIQSGDISFAIELFDGLAIGVQFWEGDDEFAPRIRYLWDENALMYLKYETMYFAVDLLRQRLLELM